MLGMLQIITYLLCTYLVFKGVELFQIALVSVRDCRRLSLAQGLGVLIGCVAVAASIYFASRYWSMIDVQAQATSSSSFSTPFTGSVDSIPPSSQNAQKDDSTYPGTHRPVDASKYRQFQIQTTNCSPIPGSHAGEGCSAEATARTISGGEKHLILNCDYEWTTCRKLAEGETYGFEVLPDGQYQECTPFDNLSVCLKIHAQPYDLIYRATEGSGTLTPLGGNK